MLPPVDDQFNAPGVVDPKPFRDQYGISDRDVTMVTVSRLHPQLKAESLFRTLDVVRTLGRDLPLRFILVGDGAARPELERLAQQINVELRRPAVLFTGALLDPRPAYAAADIIVGMGGSALRGMAFGKPVVIVGEGGFSAPLSPETAHFFYHNGIYGRGSGIDSNAGFAADVRRIIEDPCHRSFLGTFSREFVLKHFSLKTVSAKLSDLCHRAVVEVVPFPVTAADALRTTAVYFRERKYL
jgi:glycosyltransferase involved in cell wall biosynthesis